MIGLRPFGDQAPCSTSWSEVVSTSVARPRWRRHGLSAAAAIFVAAVLLPIGPVARAFTCSGGVGSKGYMAHNALTASTTYFPYGCYHLVMHGTYGVRYSQIKTPSDTNCRPVAARVGGYSGGYFGSGVDSVDTWDIDTWAQSTLDPAWNLIGSTFMMYYLPAVDQRCWTYSAI